MNTGRTYLKCVRRYVITFVILGIFMGIIFGIKSVLILIPVFILGEFIPLFKGKHLFSDVGEKSLPDFAPNWIGHICKYCDERSGLDIGQLMRNTWILSYCENGRRVSFFELFFGNINCME